MRLPQDEEGQAWFLRQMLTDTGFFCRNVLGMDTDRDPQGNPIGEPGSGGVRDHGPHKELCAFLDDDSNKNCVILAPRASYKSSIVLGFILRKILAHPNISILMFMHETEIAKERCAKMRDILTTNPVITHFFGDLKGPKWTDSSFTTSLRTDGTLQSPTLWIASPQKSATGGRPNIVLFDDIVSETNYLTEQGLKRARHCVETSLTLGSRDSRYIDVGTPYHPADAHHWCMDAGWSRMTHLDAGVEVIKDDHGKLHLEGVPRWPNLPLKHLQGLLDKGMSYQMFMSQYLLRVVSGLHDTFKRTQFQPEIWNDEVHRDLTGFLLTDTAPSGSSAGDLNVLMYAGLDERNRVYILDLEVGYWQMAEFANRYLNMLSRWQNKVTHGHEMWEKSPVYYPYFYHIHQEAKRRNIRVQFKVESRTMGVTGKDGRIAGLQCRFQAREIHVMNTVPRTWTTGTEMRELWNPTGYDSPDSDVSLPSGDLVEQFVRFPHHRRKDIPDTLALIDSFDKPNNRRFCSWIRPSRRAQPETVQRKPAVSKESYRGSASRFYDRWSS